MAVFKSRDRVYIEIPDRVFEGKEGTPEEGSLSAGILDGSRRSGHVVLGDATRTAYLLADDGDAHPLTESAAYQRMFPASTQDGYVVPAIATARGVYSVHNQSDSIIERDLTSSGVARRSGSSSEVVFDLRQFDRLGPQEEADTLAAIKDGIQPAAWAASSRARIAEGVSRPQHRIDALESQVAAKEAAKNTEQQLADRRSTEQSFKKRAKDAGLTPQQMRQVDATKDSIGLNRAEQGEVREVLVSIGLGPDGKQRVSTSLRQAVSSEHQGAPVLVPELGAPTVLTSSEARRVLGASAEQHELNLGKGELAVSVHAVRARVYAQRDAEGVPELKADLLSAEPSRIQERLTQRDLVSEIRYTELAADRRFGLDTLGQPWEPGAAQRRINEQIAADTSLSAERFVDVEPSLVRDFHRKLDQTSGMPTLRHQQRLGAERMVAAGDRKGALTNGENVFSAPTVHTTNMRRLATARRGEEAVAYRKRNEAVFEPKSDRKEPLDERLFDAMENGPASVKGFFTNALRAASGKPDPEFARSEEQSVREFAGAASRFATAEAKLGSKAPLVDAKLTAEVTANQERAAAARSRLPFLPTGSTTEQAQQQNDYDSGVGWS